MTSIYTQATAQWSALDPQHQLAALVLSSLTALLVVVIVVRVLLMEQPQQEKLQKQYLQQEGLAPSSRVDRLALSKSIGAVVVSLLVVYGVSWYFDESSSVTRDRSEL